MGRQPKPGIDYAGWSVDIFDGDRKIDKLLDARGWKGFGVYFFLCMRAYKTNGYYYEWCYDDCATTARKLGGGIDANTVKETVDLCLRVDLFSQELLAREGILTSRGIQRRYWAVLSERRVKTVYKEYWLLDPEETKGLVKVSLKSNLQPTNQHLQPTNQHLQPTNDTESKVNESKVNSVSIKPEHSAATLFTPPTIEQVKKFCEENGIAVNAQKFVSYYNANGWVQGAGKPIIDWRAQVMVWAEGDRERVKGKPKRIGFHNFDERNYDFSELERRLLNG